MWSGNGFGLSLYVCGNQIGARGGHEEQGGGQGGTKEQDLGTQGEITTRSFAV